MTTSTSTSEAVLYHEVCGAGPVALLVPGTPGDAGQFSALAAALGERYTVVSYDRRGTSRSPQPQGWTTTSAAQQADDAAAVLARVTSDTALVYGTSNGAAVALELAKRHPERVSAVLLHEMPLISVLADPEPVGQMLGELIGTAMQRGGPSLALDAFLRFAYGDDLVDGLGADLRARMLANAEMIFSIELPAFQGYRPDERDLLTLSIPAGVLVGKSQTVPMFAEAGSWLADRLGTTVLASPGAHGPHLSHPSELAALISTLDPAR